MESNSRNVFAKVGAFVVCGTVVALLMVWATLAILSSPPESEEWRFEPWYRPIEPLSPPPSAPIESDTMPEKEGTVYFKDYTDTAWGNAAEFWHDEGFVYGKGDEMFHPEDTMTRGAIAVLIMRAVEGPDYQPEGEYPWSWFNAAINEGYLLPGGGPHNNVLRADVIVLMDVLQ